MFVLPLLVFLGSAVAAGMLRRPGAVVAWADALRQASAAQATLFIALPLMGLLVGLIGLASRQSRCPLSAACAALNGVVAVCVYFQGA